MNFDEKDITNNKSLAMISYVAFLFIIPMYIKKHSVFANFHARQGRNLFVLEAIVFVLKTLNEYLFVNILPFTVFIIIGTVVSVLVLLVFSLAVLGVINAVKGESKKLPLVGGF